MRGRLLFGLWLMSAGLAMAEERPGQDWPRLLGPTGDGKSLETGLAEEWPEGGPPIVWQRKVGAGYSAPSIRGEQLILHHRVEHEEVVQSYDRVTGEPGWSHGYPSQFRDPFGYNNGPRCSPLLTEEKCYTFGAEGKLTCLKLSDGSLVWQRDTAADWKVPEAFFGVGSSPVLHDGKLIVMVGGQPNSGMVGFNAETGETLWESVGESNWQGVPMTGWRGERTVDWKPWEKQASYATPVVAQVHERTVLFALMRQGLVLMDPANGEVHDSFWFRAEVEESVNAANPVVVDEKVFISAAYYRVGGVLLEVRPELDLAEVWRDRVLEIHWSTPIYVDGYLYAFSGRNEPDARFRCVEFKTGKLMWDRDESWRRYGRGAPEVYGRGSAIFADEKLIVLGEAGLLGMFRADPTEPVELARFQVPHLTYPCWAGPVLSHKRLYLRSEDQLVCLDLGEE